MTKHLFTAVLVLALAAACALAQTGQGTGTTGAPDASRSSSATAQSKSGAASVDDTTLHRQVHEQLASNPDLGQVKVRVEKGIVFLDGTIAKGEDRQAAKDLAMSVPGVKGVEDNLTLNPSAQSGTQSQTSGGMAGATSSTTTTTQTTTSTPGSVAANPSTAPASAGTSSEQQRYVGCLQQPAAGAWVLTTASGTQYLLRGVDDLSAHRGHRVAVFGARDTTAESGSASAATAGAGKAPATGASGSVESTTGTGSQVGVGASPKGTSPVALKVNRIEHIADKCEPASPSGAMSAPSGGIAPSSGTQGTGAATTGSIGSSSSKVPASGGTATEQTTSSSGSLGTSMSSSDLKTQIDSAIHNEPTLANSNLIVNVTDDSIEISGLVPSSRDRETALRIARSYAGNRRVVDRLKANASTTGRMDQGISGTTSNPSTNSDTGNAPARKPNPR
jgi:osmotically-inducible protein OsmY